MSRGYQMPTHARIKHVLQHVRAAIYIFKGLIPRPKNPSVLGPQIRILTVRSSDRRSFITDSSCCAGFEIFLGMGMSCVCTWNLFS